MGEWWMKLCWICSCWFKRHLQRKIENLSYQWRAVSTIFFVKFLDLKVAVYGKEKSLITLIFCLLMYPFSHFPKQVCEGKVEDTLQVSCHPWFNSFFCGCLLKYIFRDDCPKVWSRETILHDFTCRRVVWHIALLFHEFSHLVNKRRCYLESSQKTAAVS